MDAVNIVFRIGKTLQAWVTLPNTPKAKCPHPSIRGGAGHKILYFMAIGSAPWSKRGLMN